MGSTHPVTWTSANFIASNYTIQYSVNGGSSWATIATNVPGTNTSYPWTVPDDPTSQGLVRVIGFDASGIQIPDQSDSVFSITKPVVTVVSPNGGEDWYVNSSHQIRWGETGLNAANYTIQYSVDGGASWIPIINNLPGTSTTHTWTVPDTPTTRGLVKVIGYDSAGTQISDLSDSVFSITKPVVTVVSPNVW